MDDPSLKHEPRGITGGNGRAKAEVVVPTRASGVSAKLPSSRVSSNVPSRAASHARDSSIDDDVSLMGLRFIDRLQTMR